jgi:hypothetical protein
LAVTFGDPAKSSGNAIITPAATPAMHTALFFIIVLL